MLSRTVAKFNAGRFLDLTLSKTSAMMSLMRWILTVILVLVGMEAITAPRVLFQFDDWVSYSIEKLQTDGLLTSTYWHTRPKSRIEVAELIGGTKIDRKGTAILNAQLYQKLQSEFEPDLRILSQSGQGRFQVRGSVQLRSYRQTAKVAPALEVASRYQHGSGLALYQEFEVANFEDKYPQEGATAGQRVNPWYGGYIGDFTRVFVQIPIGANLDLKVGRDAVFWGSSLQSAIGISDNSPTFDLISLQGQVGPVKGTAFTAKLDPMWATKPKRYLANRYLAGHRLDWQVNCQLQLAVSELVLYSGEQRGLEWYYLNPILPYYASQYNAEDLNPNNDNAMFLFDGSFRPFNGWRIFSEFLVDDFSYTGRDDPNDLALLVGLIWNNLLPTRRLTIGVTYTRVNRWTYTHLVETNPFTHFGSMIGHQIGNDADLLVLYAQYWLNSDLLLDFYYHLEQQGEAKIKDRFQGGNEHHGLDFPSGIVEKSHRLGFEGYYEPAFSKDSNFSNKMMRQTWQVVWSYQYAMIENTHSQQPERERILSTGRRFYHRHQLAFQFRWNFELAGVSSDPTGDGQ